MNIENQIIDYLHGELSLEKRQGIEQLIETDDEAKRLYEEYTLLQKAMDTIKVSEPDEEWARQFSVDLAHRVTPSAKTINLRSRNIYKIIATAAAVLIIGLLGLNTWQQRTIITQVDNDLYAIRQQMESSLNESSISTRIKAVRYSEDVQKGDGQIIKILVHTLVKDDSPHVRLAAAEALRRWSTVGLVQSTMFEALSTEEDPSVKILLIDILSESRDSKVTPYFDHLIDDETTPQFVKDEAHKGKLNLELH